MSNKPDNYDPVIILVLILAIGASLALSIQSIAYIGELYYYSSLE